MRDYGKIYGSFWSSPTVTDLSDDAKLLALYLLSSPHGNMIGAFRLPQMYVCADLKWPKERVSKGFAELFRNGFVTVCERSEWVWIRRFLHWNSFDNPNQAKAAIKVAKVLPCSCSWFQDFSLYFSEIVKAKVPDFNGLPNRYPNGSETVAQTQGEQRNSNSNSIKSAAGAAISSVGVVSAREPDTDNPEDPLWPDGRTWAFAWWKAKPERGGGAFLNKIFKETKDDERVVQAIRRTFERQPSDAKAFLRGVLKNMGDEPGEDLAYLLDQAMAGGDR